MSSSRIRCNATVDPLIQINGSKRWRVTVRGLPPYEHTRRYTIKAATDHAAAMEGIRRFCDEFDPPPAAPPQ